MDTMTRAIAAVGAALLTTLAIAAPAGAQVRVVHDKAGDGSDGSGSGGPRKWGDTAKSASSMASAPYGFG